MWNDTITESLRRYPTGILDLTCTGLSVYSIGTRVSRRVIAYDIIRRCKYLQHDRREEVVRGITGRAGPLPDDLMLTTAQLQDLSRQGVEIGGHTFSHPILDSLPSAQAREEILRGKNELEDITDAPPRLFAYPNGRPGTDYNQEHVALVKQAGFEAAVATSWGVAVPQSDLFQLPRFTPWDRSSTRYLLRIALNSRHIAQDSGVTSC